MIKKISSSRSFIRWNFNFYNIFFVILLTIFSISFFILDPLCVRDIESTYYSKNSRYDKSHLEPMLIKSSSESAYPEINIINKNPFVKRGDNVIFDVRYSGNIGNVWLSPGSIVLEEFVGTIGVQKVDDRTARITVKNIDTNDLSNPKYIRITGGTAISSTGKLSDDVLSDVFSMQRTDFQKYIKILFDISGWLLVPIILNLLTPLATPKIKRNDMSL